MSLPSLALPAGACDCHVHVVGDAQQYPMVNERHYTPAPANHDALLEHMKRNDLQRVVIIQPSFYGTDNRCMMDSLARLQGAGRGIAVLHNDVDSDTLKQFHQAGIRGIRINVESAGKGNPQALENLLRHWSSRISHLNWHLQIYVDHQTIAQIAKTINTLDVPVVLDHFAMIPADSSMDNESLKSILTLIESGNAYIKLSAPYRIAQNNSIVATKKLAQAFITANSERILWGSDWPHTNREPGKLAHEVSCYRDLSPTYLLDSIESWFPSTSIRQQAMTINPAKLYGFST